MVVFSDGVRNYMSKFLDPKWCIDLGYLPAPSNEHYGQHTVADLALSIPLTLPPTATLRDALEVFQSHPEMTHLPIVSQDKGLEGVISLDSLTDALLSSPRSGSSPSVKTAFLAEFREITKGMPLTQLHYTLRKNEIAFITQRDAPSSPKILLGMATKRDILAFIAAQEHRA